jgi:hypothetical protein
MASVYLMLIRQTTSVKPGLVGTFKLIAIAMFAGTAISGAVVIAYRLLKGKPWHTAPGEWLLIVVGVSVALDAVRYYFPRDSLIPPTTVIRSIECVATVLPTLSRRLVWPWKSYFVVIVVLQCGALALTILNATTAKSRVTPDVILGVQWSLAATIPVVLAIWYRETNSGWLHWVGVCVGTIWSSAMLIARFS